MSTNEPIKLLPRNVAALRRSQAGNPNSAAVASKVVGNSVSTRLESGVGNCFPGLECDLRNLERRFFPLLEVDIADNLIAVVGVNSAGVDAALAVGSIDAAAAESYRRVATDLAQNRTWNIVAISGSFGPLGKRDITIAALRPRASDVRPRASANDPDPPDACQRSGC